ncbi:histidine phosphatase family protein [Aestuariispira insulae]|uniref:Putative phosphoglycerate mutase n=1 Tax=Aestuariispira insulae TaxID=1461337 RepID=A0A3D9H8N5_9PROT|nr:histidine phosphatase family protein [Aestuariispira insulae]RED45848.1 putative phosphoglycerate mutase [Aestuariispira insulae]
MYPELFVIRHGETVWNREGRWQGHKNAPLTDLGKWQAARQGEILRDLGLQSRLDLTCLSSPLGRACETAEIALGALGCVFQLHDGLKEVSLGRWEGLSREDILGADSVSSDQQSVVLSWDQAPEGEGYDAARMRAEQFLAGLQGPSILVTHGAFSAVLRGLWLGLGREESMALSMEQGCVFHLSGGKETILREAQGEVRVKGQSSDSRGQNSFKGSCQ